jgi:hypothetical protein
MLAFAAEVGRARRADRLLGEFVATAKNAPASGIYERCGFTRVGDTQFEFVLGKRPLPYPAHVRFHATSPNAGS